MAPMVCPLQLMTATQAGFPITKPHYDVFVDWDLAHLPIDSYVNNCKSLCKGFDALLQFLRVINVLVPQISTKELSIALLNLNVVTKRDLEAAAKTLTM